MSVPPDILDVDIIEQLVDRVGVGVAMYGEEGKFLYVNSAYAAMLDTDQERLVGEPIWTVNPEFDPDRFERYWDSFAEGESRVAEAIHEYEGARAQVSTVTTRTRVDGTTYHLGTVRDISRRKEREQQLEQLHAVTRGLLAADSREEIAEIAARTAETILGYEQSVVRFAEDGALRPVAVSTQARETLGDRPDYPVDGDTPAARAYRAGEAITVDDARALDDGYDRGNARALTYVPIGEHGVLSVVAPVENAFDEADVYVASILGSNTAAALTRLQNERNLEHQNERFEVFYDVISHDIPNHLSVAQTRLELARQTDDLGQLDAISTAHERIETVLEDMETLVTQGQQVDQTDRVRLSEIATRCWESSQPAAEATLDIDRDGHVEADATRLAQLFENLFWNAVEHGGTDVTVRVGVFEDGFYVADDGPGIPESEREDVLAPGYTTADDHSGFGLAIVREVARAHDWTVEITDSAAGGARFELTGARVEL